VQATIGVLEYCPEVLDREPLVDVDRPGGHVPKTGGGATSSKRAELDMRFSDAGSGCPEKIQRLHNWRRDGAKKEEDESNHCLSA